MQTKTVLTNASFSSDALHCGAAQHRVVPCGVSTQRIRCERSSSNEVHIISAFY